MTGRTRLFLSARDFNLLLREQDAVDVRFEHGCLVVFRKLPLGGVTAVAVPSVQRDLLVLTLPFDQIRGDLTGGLFGHLTRMFWGFVSEQVERQVWPQLYRVGLPSDTVTVDQVRLPDGQNAGRILISLRRFNEWLARRAGAVKVLVQDADFTPEGVGVNLVLSR